MMRVGINALFQASGGSLTNLRQMLAEWHRAGTFAAHETVFFLSQGTRDRLRDVLPPTSQQVVLGGADGSLAGRVFVEQSVLPRRLRQYALDVLYCPANTMPWRSHVPCVVTFQNAAPFTSSITPASVGWRRWLRFQVLGTFMRVSARRATRVIFGSRHFRELFLQRCSVPHDKTIVIYRTSAPPPSGTRPDPAVEARYGVQRPYLLSVSHLQPYKNLLELIAGFDMARRRGVLPGVQLVLAGGAYGGARYVERIEHLARERELGPQHLRLIGDVPHGEVHALLAGCDAFVFSSTCENCPTSLIEALALGRPIACSQASSMPEIAGSAALYFDPDEPVEIASCLTRLYGIRGLKQALARRARQRTTELPDPSAVARQTWEAICSAAPAGQKTQRRAA